MAYNISMTSRDQVLALINENTGLSLSFSQVEFDVPAINSDPTQDRNTELVINGIPDFGFKGTASVYYDRIDLSEFVGLARVPFVIQVDVDPDVGVLILQDIIDAFNLYFNSALEEGDITDSYLLPVDWANGESFTMEANSWSYAYQGNVSFIVRPLDIDIDLALVNKLLDGLELTSPT